MAFFMNCCGVLFTAYVLASATRIVERSHASDMELQERLLRVTHFFRHNGLSKALHRQVLEYHKFVVAECSSTDMVAALSVLPQRLQVDVVSEFVQTALDRTLLFSGCSGEFMVGIVKALQPRVAVPDEVLVKQGTCCNKLFLVQWGSLLECVTEREPGTSPQARRQGSHDSAGSQDSYPWR